METTVARRSVREIGLRLGHRLVIRSEQGEDVVELVGPADGVALSLRVGREGAVLELGGSLELRATGQLRLDAELLALHGRSGLELTSGGDVVVRTPADLQSEARIQRIRSTLGNVEIEANDDVRIDGERVMVNC